MAQNQVATNKPKFSVAIQSEGYQKLINNTLGDPKVAKQFVTDISTVVSINPTLSKCDAGSILSAGLVAQSMKLPLSPSLGFAYLVPYGDKAQFLLGYRGLIQLALRTKVYKNIHATAIKEGEVVKIDPIKGIYEFKPIEDDLKREKAKIVGFYAILELKEDGFVKEVYWSREKMMEHGKKYSKNFSSTNSLWATNFETMGCKTILRHIIQRWGIMSIDSPETQILAQALEKDMAIINEDGTHEYADNPQNDAGDDKDIIQQSDDVELEVVVDDETGEVKEEKSVKSQEDLLNMILND